MVAGFCVPFADKLKKGISVYRDCGVGRQGQSGGECTRSLASLEDVVLVSVDDGRVELERTGVGVGFN